MVAKKQILLFVFYFTGLIVANSQNLLLTGFIYDRESKSPLPGVNITVKNSQFGFSADSLGKFEILLSAGTYVLNVSHVGYKARSISVSMDRHRDVNIALTEELRTLDEIEVSAERSDHNIVSTEIGANKLNIETISTLPSFMGEVDIIKSILLLPGVTNVGEGTSGLNIRGGNEDQNLILMDGAPFFNSGHLLGFFSVFNPDAVRNITLYKGGIPAQYGGRSSSVLDVRLKSPSIEKWLVKGGVGLVANRLCVDGPIIPNKMALMLAGRISYPDYLLKISSKEEIRNTRANFFDLTMKLEHKFSDRSRLELSSYISKDNFKLTGDSLSNIEINATSTIFSWQSKNVSTTWHQQLNSKIFLHAGLVQSIYEPIISASDSSNAFDLRSKVRYRNIHANIDWEVGRNHQINLGLSSNHYKITPGTITPGHPSSSINYFSIPDESGIELVFFASDEWAFTDKLSLQLGARLSNWLSLGSALKYEYAKGRPKSVESIIDTLTYKNNETIRMFTGVEPRVFLTYRIGPTSSIKAGYNRMYQYIQQVSNTTTALPTDRWQLTTKYIDPQRVDQISAGYFRNFMSNKFETSLELFYKDIDNITDYKDGANLILNSIPETAMLQGKGRAYGLEILMKKNKGVLTGWLSYTYSQIHFLVNSLYPEERINNGQWYPANYNKPNNLSLSVNYKHDTRITYSANFVYSTGRPYTSPESKYIVNGIYVPNFTGRNQNRIPDYHRLDLSATIDSNPKKSGTFKGSWTFSIYNVYARKNAYSVFFRTKNDSVLLAYKKVNSYKLSILGTIFPSITYNFSF